MTALEKHLDRLAKLRLRTIARGASLAEQESAQIAIGKILMECNELAISIGSQPQARMESARKSSEWIILEECFLLRKTDKAGLFSIPGGEIWIPKSLIDFADSYLAGGSVCVKKWFYEQRIEPILAAGVA